MSRRCLAAIPRALASLVVVAGLLLFIPAAASAQPTNVHKPNATLTASWWQTYFATPGNSFDRCDLGTGQVVFLAGTTTSDPATRTCTIKTGSSILVPLINIECSEVEGNGTTFAELQKCASGFADEFTDLSLVIDGRQVGGLTDLRVQTPLFTFESVEGNIFGVKPISSTISVSDGYWALIRPLPPGQHTISFGGSYPPGGFTTQVTYNLTVRPGRA